MPELKIIDRTKDRYHSLAISSVWELEKIRCASALVVGAGALGNEVCKSLAMMGVRRIVVLDRDTVEVANLSRSVFFRERDHGRPKVDVIAERLKELNPDVETLTLEGDLDSQLGMGLIRRMDMVFSCLDSRLARRTLSRMCERVGKSWVDGAMEDLLGEVTVYIPDKGPCYECGLSADEKLRIAEAASCRGIALRNLSMGKVPTTPTMGSIIASLQVQEAIKLLHGDKRNVGGKRFVVNCNINDFYLTASELNPECEGHERFGDVTEVPEFTAAGTLAREVLERFRLETGEDGFIELGREIVFEFECSGCGRVEPCGKGISGVEEAEQMCLECGAQRVLKTTHTVKGADAYAEWPLKQLSVPRLEVLEVRGATAMRWYELTGDVEELGLGAKAEDPGRGLAMSA